MLNFLPAGAQMMTQNALGSITRQPRVTNIERNPTTPLADTVKPKPKWYEVVGRIGDTMALMGDRQPLYSAFTAQDAAAARQAREAEEMEMQRNALAQFLGGNEQLQQFLPLAQAGMAPQQISQIAGLMGGNGKMPNEVQLVEYINNPNNPIEQRQMVADILNNRGLTGAMVGTPDTGWTTNPNFRPLRVPGQGQQQAPQQQILPRSARPQGMTDDQLFDQARRAVENGAPVEQVFQQLREWGVEI